jgi:mRNA-degrading endonuclease RelE of RelBE toxin-antitoxin system
VKIEISDEADKAIGKMDRSLQKQFDSHITKISNMRPTRYIKYQNIEEVGDGRIIYHIDKEEDTLYILRCFPDHKSYDKYRNSLR